MNELVQEYRRASARTTMRSSEVPWRNPRAGAVCKRQFRCTGEWPSEFVAARRQSMRQPQYAGEDGLRTAFFPGKVARPSGRILLDGWKG